MYNKKTYENTSTGTTRKDDVTEWARTKLPVATYGMSAYLVGCYDGFDRHYQDNVNLGYSMRNQVMVEQDPETCAGLKAYRQSHLSKYRNMTIKEGNMLDIIRQYPSNTFSRADMDTAVGFDAGIGDIIELSEMEIETIAWTISARSSVAHYWPEEKGGWENRWSGGIYGYNPPIHVKIVKSLLEELFPEYTIHSRAYVGVRSKTSNMGGSQMEMHLLIRK